MVYSYYPGCTLKTKAKELDAYARASAKALGAELEEIDNWQCCGGVYPLGSDEIATKLSSVRTLQAANAKGQELVTVCSACHHVLKRVNDDMKNVPDIIRKVNNYQDVEYHGETTVIHFLEFLKDRIGFDKIKEKAVNPLTGRKIGAYYGCLLLRPNSILEFDDPENPTVIEEFIRALGAEPVVYPYRNECCGGYISLKDKALSGQMVDRILESAAYKGAQMLVTACPLCRYNLMNGGKARSCQGAGSDSDGNAADAKDAAGGISAADNQSRLPVVYFTELLAEALGVKEEAIAMMNQRETKWSKAAAEQSQTEAGGEQHA